MKKKWLLLFAVAIIALLIASSAYAGDDDPFDCTLFGDCDGMTTVCHEGATKDHTPYPKWLFDNDPEFFFGAYDAIQGPCGNIRDAGKCKVKAVTINEDGTLTVDWIGRFAHLKVHKTNGTTVELTDPLSTDYYENGFRSVFPYVGDVESVACFGPGGTIGQTVEP